MGRDYVVQLHSEDGAWRGTLRGPEGERSFDSVVNIYFAAGC